MKRPSKIQGGSVFTRIQQTVSCVHRMRQIVKIAASLFIASAVPLLLRAQAPRSLTEKPAITVVGVNDQICQDTLADLQRMIREFAFVRGHQIFLVCDQNAWNHVTHHLTMEYGAIVNSRAAISDIRLRETWFYAEALRHGVEGHSGEYVYAHELGHFVCSCIDEAAADKAAAQLLDDLRRNRLNATAAAPPAGGSK